MSAPDLLARTAAVLRELGLMEPECRLVVGVSGGVDSMVLLDLLVRLGRPVLAAHVQYNLRGEASEADEALVRARCTDLRVSLEVARYDTKRVSREAGASVQVAARDLRYQFFRQLALDHGARAVAVAHHADDQAETLLLNLFRGTGIDGLAGMPVARTLAPGAELLLIRPLLMAHREELEAYAREQGVPWREDASNQAPDYRRTLVRTRILPLVEEAFGGSVRQRLARTAGFVRTYLDTVLDADLQARFAEAAVPAEKGGQLRTDVLLAQPPHWRGRLMLHALALWLPDAPRSAVMVARLDALLAAQPGRRVELEEGVVWRERDGLLFLPHAAETRPAPPDPVELFIDEGEYRVPGGMLTVRQLHPPLRTAQDDAFVAMMDANALKSCLVVRRWRAGDRMQPLGMMGSKKISDLLTDARVPVHSRQQTVVLESGGAIVWVPGLRLAHHVRVRPETTGVWQLHYRPD